MSENKERLVEICVIVNFAKNILVSPTEGEKVHWRENSNLRWTVGRELSVHIR